MSRAVSIQYFPSIFFTNFSRLARRYGFDFVYFGGGRGGVRKNGYAQAKHYSLSRCAVFGFSFLLHSSLFYPSHDVAGRLLLVAMQFSNVISRASHRIAIADRVMHFSLLK